MPDGGDAGKPDDDEEAGKVDWDGDAIVGGAEDFDGEIDEERRDEIGGETETG